MEINHGFFKTADYHYSMNKIFIVLILCLFSCSSKLVKNEPLPFQRKIASACVNNPKGAGDCCTTNEENLAKLKGRTKDKKFNQYPQFIVLKGTPIILGGNSCSDLTNSVKAEETTAVSIEIDLENGPSYLKCKPKERAPIMMTFL